MNGGVSRLRDAYRNGGLKDLARTLDGYIRWRLAGSPIEVEEPLHSRLEQTDSSVVVVLMRDYYARATPEYRPVISVVLATRDRPEHLKRALASVIDQTYDNWDLVVVNDSDSPLGEGVVPQHPQIRIVDSGGVGVSAARNRGLDEATGEYVTFLDDDNLMDPLWLLALADSINQSPQADVFIGAQLVTPDPGYHEHHSIRFPPRFEWEALIRDNFVDMGMLAHRADPSHRFDESLPALVDWDYVVRLTMNRTPVLVPAVAGLYRTDASSRISYTDRQHLVEEMRERFATLRPVEPTLAHQVLGAHDVNAMITMLGRIAGQTGAVPTIHLATNTPLVESLADALAAAGVAVVGPADEARVVITDAGPGPKTMAAVRRDGYLVGLNAHRIDYASNSALHGRPIGDHLWVGARTRWDPEDLFEGATLVKFGVVER